MHQGTIEARSAGLPRGRVRGPAAARGGSSSDVPDSGPREIRDGKDPPRDVLVVDDNRDAAESLAISL